MRTTVGSVLVWLVAAVLAMALAPLIGLGPREATWLFVLLATIGQAGLWLRRQRG